MALHDSLRELVAARGAAVVDDATELRGALDDFLGEDEATIGELNLLVDAVRLGGLDRLLTMLDNGAAPAAAVAEAGAALARDRGSDDSRRASWAVAALGFALGRVEAGVVERSLPTAAPVDPKPATPPPPPPPPPTPQRSPEPDPGSGTVGSAEAVPTAFDRERSVPVSPPPGPPAPSVRRRKRRSVVLLAVSFAVVLGLVGGIGLALWLERDTGSQARDPEDPGTSENTARPSKRIAPSSILITYRDGSTGHPVYEVDAEEGGGEPLTSGPQDHLPTISPDRTEVTFLDGEAQTPRILMLRDVDSGDTRAVFPPAHESCSHTLRPGWSPDGSYIALVCTDDGTEGVGLFLANPDSSKAFLLTDQPGVEGSPTWTDENTIVYTRTNEEDDSSTLWSLDIDLDDKQPVGEPRPLLLEDNPEAVLTHPDWSEEARKLLFVVHDDPKSEFGEVVIANADFSDQQSLGGPYGHPVWSPEGDAIAFTIEEGEGDDAVERLAVADFDGETLSPPHILEDVPEGEVGIPVWGSR